MLILYLNHFFYSADVKVRYEGFIQSFVHVPSATYFLDTFWSTGLCWVSFYDNCRTS